MGPFRSTSAHTQHFPIALQFIQFVNILIPKSSERWQYSWHIFFIPELFTQHENEMQITSVFIASEREVGQWFDTSM